MKAGYWLAIVGAAVVGGALLDNRARNAKPKPAAKPIKKPTVSVTEQSRKFVAGKVKTATDVQKKHGIPFLFALAQWGLESGWGTRAPKFNFMGIKSSSSWKGKTQVLWTSEYIDGKKVRVQRTFRAYDSFDQAVNDWVELLKKPRYKEAFKYKNNPRQFAREIAKAGYATSPTYANVLVGLIDKIETEIKKNVKK